MLPAAHRLRDASSFRDTTRRGRRASARLLVVHLTVGEGPSTPRAGFVVSKAVGNSVVRNRVKRRLRHLVAERLAELAAGTSLVIRALPGAASATSAELGSDLDRCLGKLAPAGAPA